MKRVNPPNEPVKVGRVTVKPGERKRIELPVARLFTGNDLTLPVELVNGAKPGPRIWLSAALHGDELNGLEIIHRVLEKVSPAKLHGEILAVPVVNVLGFIRRERYLPDGRDLNRCFPGNANGSLASRLANIFMKEIVGACDCGIDLHTAGGHRTNLPQVRGDLNDAHVRTLAEAFAAPCMIHGEAPKGSLRGTCSQKGIPLIVYEAGEPHRFNSDAIDIGVKGVLRVLGALGIRRTSNLRQRRQSMEATKRTWVRSRRSGIFRLKAKLGSWVSEDQLLGTVVDAFGVELAKITSPAAGLVIGHTHHPVVDPGDALIHLATEVVTEKTRD